MENQKPDNQKNQTFVPLAETATYKRLKKAGGILFHGLHKILAPKVGEPMYVPAVPKEPVEIRKNMPGLEFAKPFEEQSLLQKLMPKIATSIGGLQKQKGRLPTPTPAPATATVVNKGQDGPQQNYGGYSLEDYKNAIEEGFAHWGSPPAATLSGQMTAYIKRYPIYQKHPFLLPALTLLETGGGRKMKYPNNITNWGIYADFHPKSVEETLDKTATGIAERFPMYEQFRKTGDLRDLGRVYAPLEDNPQTGGDHYARNAEKIMDVFRSKLKRRT